MHDPFPSFSDRVSQDPNASHFRAPQNADDSIYSPSGGDVPTPTPSAPPEKQFKDFHGPLHPAYEWVKENFGLAPEDRALRDNTLNKGTGLSPEGAWWYKPQVGEDTSKMALLRDGNPSLVAPSFAGSTLGTPKSSAGLEALMAAQKTPATTRTPTTPAALTAALTATPRPRVPGTLTTKPKADADTTAPAAKTASIEDLQKKFDETGKLPDFKKLSAEERAAQKNEDLWTSLAQIGFGMAAGKSQNALSNIGEGAAAAMPGMQAALKERRADEKDERKQEFDYLVKAAGAKGDNLKSAYSVFNNMADREQRETLEGMRIKAQASEGRFNRENQLAAAGISANALPPDVRTLKYLEAHPGAEALYNRVEAAKNPLGMLRAQSDITAAELGIDKTNQRALDAARRNAVAQPNNLAYAQAYTKLQLEIEQKKAAARARIMGATPNFGPTGGGGANVIHSAADYFKGS
jgi:hypothetical protein